MEEEEEEVVVSVWTQQVEISLTFLAYLRGEGGTKEVQKRMNEGGHEKGQEEALCNHNNNNSSSEGRDVRMTI